MSLRHSRITLPFALAAIAVLLTTSHPEPLLAEGEGSAQSEGSVGLRDLIALALQNDPGLVALRQNIPVEEARKRAAAQWRDPELRVGFSKDEDLSFDPTAITPQRLAGAQTNNLRVRFWVPKPGEMKAIVNQAAAEVDLADYKVTAAEREIILDVRSKYEELQFLSRKLEASRQQIEIIEKYVAKEQELLNAGGTFTLDKLSFDDLKIPGMRMAVDAAETELKAAKRSLAARVGLSDGSRIRVSDTLLRSGIDLQDTDLDYLTLMAFAHRGEVGVLRHEQAIAEAELKVLKRQSIPWFSFIQTEYAEDVAGGDPSDQAYGVQVGVILPVFSSLAKDEKIVEARVESYYAMLEANQKNIANEVAEAFQSVREASSHRARTSAAVERHTRTMAKRSQDLEASADLAAKEKLRYDTELERNKLQEYQLASDQLFNQSLIRLEKALGADLDRVFRVEYESLGADAPIFREPRDLPVSPPEKPTPSAMRATLVPVPEASARGLQGGEAKPRKKGLFQFLKEQNGSGSRP